MHKLNTKYIKIPARYFMHKIKLILKFIQKIKRIRIAKTYFRKKNK